MLYTFPLFRQIDLCYTLDAPLCADAVIGSNPATRLVECLVNKSTVETWRFVTNALLIAHVRKLSTRNKSFWFNISYIKISG